MNQKITVKLILLCALTLSNGSIFANEITPKVGQDGLTFQEREAKREEAKQAKEQKREDEKPDRLKSEYGFTDDEVANFMQLQKEHRAKLKAITESKTLSKDEKYNRKQSLNAKHHEQLKSILTPSQFSTFQSKYSSSREKIDRNIKVNELKRECFKELKEVYELPVEQREQKREEIKSRYETTLTAYLSLEKAQKEIQLVSYQLLVNKKGGRKQDLSHVELRAVGRALDKGERRKDSIAMLDIGDVSIKRRHKAVNNLNKNKIRNTLDESAITAMTTPRNPTTHKQQYKTRYNFTDEQYAKLVEIENEYAVQRLVIKKSAITMEEKEAAVKKIYWQKINKIKELIPEQLQEEWSIQYRVINRPNVVSKKKKKSKE